MLGVMISLASIARVPAPAFNSAFNSTVATIIPVLFLALAVQGRVYQDVAQAALTMAREKAGSLLRDGHVARFAQNRPGLLVLGLTALTTLGMLGEANAIMALYNHSYDTSAGRLFTLVAVLSLTLVVFLRPFMMGSKAARELADIQFAAGRELLRKVLADESTTVGPTAEPQHPAVQADAIPEPGATADEPRFPEAGQTGDE